MDVSTVKNTDGVDGKKHVSITGIFLVLTEDGSRSMDKPILMNVRKDTHLVQFTALEEIAKLSGDDKRTDRLKAIDAYNAQGHTWIYQIIAECGWYKVYDIKDSKPVARKQGSWHRTMAGAPIFANQVSVFGFKAETMQTTFDRKVDTIRDDGMMLTADNAEEYIGEFPENDKILVIMQHVKDARAKADAGTVDIVVEGAEGTK